MRKSKLLSSVYKVLRVVLQFLKKKKKDLFLLMAVNHHLSAGNCTQVLSKNSQSFLTSEPLFQPQLLRWGLTKLLV